MTLRVGLATCSALPSLDDDDAAYVAALLARGVEPVCFAWDAGLPSKLDVVVIRSTWDYIDRVGEFVAWAERCQQHTRLLNPAEVVRFNSNKKYLDVLRQQRVPTIPTLWAQPGDDAAQLALAARERFGHGDVILKPTVGAGARHTHRTSTHSDMTSLLTQELATKAMMIQPFLRSVLSGEVSLVFMRTNGRLRLSHAVKKTPAQGDYRTQEQFGAVVTAHRADDDEQRLAEQVVDVVGGNLLYARVDLVRLADDSLAVIEVELIEPSLYFTHDAQAADRFADATLSAIERP
jgi:glutathione synthase/RimK-type ligase-like ATP-grasp enzyme